MAVHRYWRILITAVNGDPTYLNIAEVELRESVGGADVTGSGTASASGTQGGSFVAASAFDNNAGSGWAMQYSGVLPQWLAYDFGAGNAKDIQQVALTCFYHSQHPKAWQLQHSDDGTTWTSVPWSVDNSINWTAGETRTFAAPAGAAHRYWRLKINQTQNGIATTSCAELVLRASAGGASLIGSGTPIASSIYADSLNAAKAFDGSNGTFWVSSFNAGMPQWIGYDFGANNAKAVTQVSVTARGDGFGAAEAVKIGSIDYSDDGIVWGPLLAIPTQSAWAEGETRTFGVTVASARSAVFVCT